MKKIILPVAFILLFFVSRVDAQISKGSVILGTGISYSTQKYDGGGGKNQVFGISPSVGLAIGTNSVIGLSYSYNSTKNSNMFGSSYIDSRGYDAGIFLRQYRPIAGKLYVFAHEALIYSRNHIKVPEDVYIQHQYISGIGLQLNPGISYSLGKKWQVEAIFNGLFGISYTNTKTEHISVYNAGNIPVFKSSEFSAGINPSDMGGIAVGFKFLFAK